MKKIIIGLIVFVVVLAFTFPLYADKPANPGVVGQEVSAQAQAGTRADVVASVKASTLEKNFGQAVQAYLDGKGIPYKHTP